MSNVINYSKFDKIILSSSDDEKYDKKKPHITTLNNKEKVSIGPNGITILKDEKKYNEENNIKDNIKNDNINNEKKKENDNLKKMILNGGVIINEYIWNQSKDYINAYISLPLDIKAKTLIVDIYEDGLIVKNRNEENENEKNEENENEKNKKNKKNEENKKNEKILIKKNFPFKICTNEDTQIWEIKNIKINWKELLDLSNKINNQNIKYNFNINLLNDKIERFLFICLKKNNEIKNSYLWWSCLFKGDNEINVLNLPIRNSNKKNMCNFENVWNEAHKIFKKNISNKTINIPLD